MKKAAQGELEIQVMDILWDSKESSISDIWQKVSQKRKIAYTTVATILQRLYEKGIVVRNNQGNHHVYVPKFTKEVYSKKIIQTFLNKLVHNFGEVATTSFAESIGDLPNKEKNKLLELLKKV